MTHERLGTDGTDLSFTWYENPRWKEDKKFVCIEEISTLSWASKFLQSKQILDGATRNEGFRWSWQVEGH